jgi:hypothetical protein
MNISQHLSGQEAWSATYCGRPIAILNCSGRWHVYLDHVLQHSVVFATSDQAVAWLMTSIDDEFLALVHASRGRNGQQCLRRDNVRHEQPTIRGLRLRRWRTPVATSRRVAMGGSRRPARRPRLAPMCLHRRRRFAWPSSAAKTGADA